ncbi:MAG: hypothetical protein MZV64_01205 [Ignavibacteriales bacterium]|nr:hypothetical protein [Ignavibacteriales bacterium]
MAGSTAVKLFLQLLLQLQLSALFIIIFFNEYFATSELLTENLILYSLRNITLGAMGFFGMAVQEVLEL